MDTSTTLLGISACLGFSGELAAGECVTDHRNNKQTTFGLGPLRYRDIPKARKSISAAFKDDPMNHYLTDTPDAKHTRMEKIFLDFRGTYYMVMKLTSTSITLTVNHGDAVIFASYAPNSKEDKTKPLDKLTMKFFRSIVLPMTYKFLSSEQKKRNQELSKKVNDLVPAILGAKINDMMYVDLLATDPSYQGRGYASALLDCVSHIADEQHRETWLVSSNYSNTAFYQSHGYEVEGKVILGDENEVWTEPPVIVAVMVRRPTPAREKGGIEVMP